ncbi:baculoviral IAP repeat-containing protein 5 [Patella vulgata]|uniref:baculoviral IAP repeat-containing protein 5 n=1 Tax=Patella vulgata TaxID=6465 RepID=UPI0021800833|nr:baculoviral IAP repeat-containing protein 5 [Patella vulgata]
MSNNLMSDYYMHLLQYRLESFKVWPFDDDWKCTPQRLAEAGFYHCPTDQEPDAVCCFLCFKELDGWEPTDDPWEEHVKHSPNCPFLKINKPIEELTVEQFIKLEIKRQKNKMQKILDSRRKEFEHHGHAVREEMQRLV